MLPGLFEVSEVDILSEGCNFGGLIAASSTVLCRSVYSKCCSLEVVVSNVDS